MFRTYAPNARGITVVDEFNGWKEEPLRQLHQSGVWVGSSRTAKPGQMYTRTDRKQTLLVLFNFSEKEAVIAPELDGKITMHLNTDREPFGGKTKR